MKPVGDIAFPKMEEEVLHFWQDKKIFQAQDELRKDAEEFSFYDGPPFANGLPHYGHLLAATIKDTVPRYWIMKGHKIVRRFGWDCHGLPVEFEIEKREKLRGRPDILKMGVAKFNETCRESVLQYVENWRKTITRLGRWVDWDNQYKTMDRDFMESVWWVFGQLHEKGLIYKDFKVVPYSPRTTSVVSNFEANQNYKNVSDPSIFVKFKLKDSSEYVLVWTTTPWTLPSNLALAIRNDILYVRVRDTQTNEVWILAKETLGNLYGKFTETEKPFEVLSEELGETLLLNRSYEPLFPYFKDHENAFRIFHAAYVATTDGTGVVHQAPAFGEDDFFNCKLANIKLVDPIDDTGHFSDQIPELSGQYFKDADKTICRLLKEKGSLVKQATLVHSYPFDERTDTPLMFRAVPSWYVAVEKFGDRLVANNQTINWVPGHLREGRMGSWLRNARDWAISRNRFWGTPLPVWICDRDPKHVKIISSIAELEAKVSKEVPDIHLHYVSELPFACSDCDGLMKNEGLVFDCWFESGSMPYSQLHYPFEEKDRFAKIFPADFVAEGVDQTRGWFYTLNVLATALFDKPAFKNVIVNGVILDESGKKMSKRHRNYTPPDELVDKYGADSVRLYMLNSPLLRAEDLIFVDQGVKDVTRLVLLPLWNALSFLTTYASADGWVPHERLVKGDVTYLQTLTLDEMDQWILSRMDTLMAAIEKHMSEYKLYLVVPEIVEFIDGLTNWYIRLSRRRFWGVAESDKKISDEQQAAFSTLYFVLLNFSKMLAPFAPFISDKIFKELVQGFAEAPLSVHLCDMPSVVKGLRNEALEQRMDILQTIVTNGRALRQKHKLKVRQVLPSLTVISRKKENKTLIEEGLGIITNELNVKTVHFTTEEAKHVRLSLKPNLRTLGARLGAKLRDVTQFLAETNKKPEEVVAIVNAVEEHGTVDVLGHSLTIEDFLIDRQPLDESLIASEKGLTILLDTKLTPELIGEGRARELVNRIQNLRKDSGLLVSDRIDLQIIAPKTLAQDVEAHREYILNETLGKRLEILENGAESTLRFVESYQIDDMTCIIALEVQKN